MKNNYPDLKEILPRLASTMKRLTKAASGNLGSDCYIHAAIAQSILSKLGVESRLTAGWAAWRVGPGDSDMITHAPVESIIPQPGGMIYHMWLEIGSRILDLTTHSFRIKARHLDMLDGGHTTVVWCPDFLFVDKKSVTPLKDVIQHDAGMYYYSQQPAVEAIVIDGAPELDMDDVNAAWMLYQNQDMVAFGPNDVMCITSVRLIAE